MAKFVIVSLSFIILGIVLGAIVFNRSGEIPLNEFEKKKVFLGKNEFLLYIADTPVKQARGLMYVKDLPQNEGMIFTFKKKSWPIFYNKNTLIPLDLVWISAGVVAQVSFLPAIKGIIPTFIRPVAPVDAVIELSARSVEQYGIKIGDLLQNFQIQK